MCCRWGGVGWGGVGLRWQNMQVFTNPMVTLVRPPARQVLLAAGAKVNQPSECGMTALHLAVWHRHPEAVKVLLQAKVGWGRRTLYCHGEAGRALYCPGEGCAH